MSINMDSEPEVEYSAFEHQHFRFQMFAENADENQANTTNFDPLQSKGGLDSDQVAELVAARVGIQVSPDNLNDIVGQDQAEGSYEFRGAFGSDISLDDIVGNSPQNRVDGSEIGNDFQTLSTTEPAIFDQFDHAAMIGFSDAAAGAGGSGTTVDIVYDINMRSLFGRGPVLDAADNLTVAAEVIKNNVAADLEANYSASLVWDTSTIEGDRRQFSVP